MTEETQWEIIPSETKEHWLKVRDPEGWWEAYVKWDGCLHISHASNVPFDNHNGRPGDAGRNRVACDSGMHICDLDDFIIRLQTLRAEAVKHFGGEWPL